MNEPDERHEAGAAEPSARVAVRLPARISTIDAETDPFTGKSFFRSCEETSANLSRGGMFVTMRETIPPGRRVLVELEMPGGRTLQTVGRVAWTRTCVRAERDAQPAGSARDTEPGVGIQFLAGPADDRRLLDRFVARALRRSEPRRRAASRANPAT